VPSHNEQYRLHETLRIYGEAMSRRLGEDFEIIVIVNGSTDGMVARLP
jgi:glycosyltransferase involved in cell wall biosynthesis